MRNNLLLLTQSAHPRPAVAARRLRHLAEWGRAQFDRVFAIRGHRAGYAGEEVEGVVTFPIPLRDLRQLLGGVGPAGTLPPGAKAYRLPLRLRQSFPLLYLTDDGGSHYRYHAYRTAVRLVEREGITTVLSSFRPWSDHLVARRLKRRFPHLYWIADFRDLHADPVRRDVWWPALQRWWAQRVLATADEVWGVSRGQVQHLQQLYSGASVRRNRLTKLPPPTTAAVSERFTIVYTGSLYAHLQTIDPLITALNQLVAAGEMPAETIELLYRGKDDGLWTQWVAPLHPAIHRATGTFVTPATAQTLQENAQVLLLLNWSADDYYGVLTAKLYEYLATGRPILALVNGPGDPELKEIIEGAQAGRVFASGESPGPWLLHCYQQWWENGKRFAWSVDRGVLTAYLQPPPLGQEDTPSGSEHKSR